MYYAINNRTDKIAGIFSSINELYKFVKDNETEYRLVEDLNMHTVKRVTFVDNVCIYNNKDFWLNKAIDIINDYENHTVTDILGIDVNLDRFIEEYNTICPKIVSIDGRPGQIQYNMEVGQEFISLFREECIVTKFTKDSDTSPMIIFKKLDTVINMLQIGGFREARQFLQEYRAQIRDDFLTNERLDKYIAMLNSADAIEYATDEDYFYVVSDTPKEL